MTNQNPYSNLTPFQRRALLDITKAVSVKDYATLYNTNEEDLHLYCFIFNIPFSADWTHIHLINVIFRPR